MPFIKFFRDRWLAISEERRGKIVYEIGSILNTFIAAFLLQLAVDIEAAKFVIQLDTAVLVAMGAAALRSGIKAILQMFVAWARNRFSR